MCFHQMKEPPQLAPKAFDFNKMLLAFLCPPNLFHKSRAIRTLFYTKKIEHLQRGYKLLSPLVAGIKRNK